ncbi:MAG: hypothetical protein J5978_03735 [Spirochaetaceae bacterium]|nr:hypothetical protein [Spirochaetaceae bacterium]
MIFSGGFGFAGAGKIKPASGETINLVWNGPGTGWTATNGSDQTIDVKWLNQNDKTSTEAGGDVNITGPDGTDDIIALCTLNGEVTLTLEADLTISTLFVFGGYPCTINLNGKKLEITDTLYLGSSNDNRTDGTDIDRGTIENDKTSDEDNRLGNLTLSGEDGSNLIVENVNTSTWNWGNTKDSDGNTVNNNSLTINNSVALSVTSWDTGRIGGAGTGATKTEVVVNGGTVEIEKITGKTWELVDGLYSEFENVTGSVTIPTRPLGWIGTASTEWNVGENWANGNVPNENTETVYISKTNNQPVISSEVKLTGKIELVDGAKLTIAEGGSLSIDANNITFGTDSSVVVNGILNSTKGYTVNSNFAGSTGTFSCSDSSNPLIIDTDLELSGNLISSNGTITINSGKNVTCNSISAATLENNGNLTLNDDSSIGNLSINETIKIDSGKKLFVSGSNVTLGNISGIIELIGSTDLWYLNLSETSAGVDTIIVNKEKDENDNDKNVKFSKWQTQTSKIKNVVIESGITTFDTPIEIEKFSTSENAGDITFYKNTTIKNACEIKSKNTVSFGSDENSTTTFGTEENPVNFTHTAGKTLITGKLSANDVTLGETSINGTVTANNITLEATEIKGESELKINEAATSGKITLKGNITSTGSKNLTLNGNVEIPSTSQLEINLNEGILRTKDIKSESSLLIKAKTQTFDGEIFVAKDFTSEGETFTFADKVSVKQDAKIQNTGLLKISDFVYGKSFVQKGSESKIGQVMIFGSFEQFEESGESENQTATFGSNVYFYNSSQNLSEIVIGSDKSSIIIDGNLIIAKSKENDVAIKGTVKSNNFALYSGNVDLSGSLSTINDVVILGEKYSLKDNQTGIENLYSYTENRPAHWSQASYTFETSLPDGTGISKNYAGTVKVLPEKSITVGKNLYANGTVFALSGVQGSGTWNLIVPDTSVAANAFCEVYNSEVSDCVAAYQIAALQCKDKSGNINWAFDDETGTVKITKAYSVSDNVIRVEFNKPVRILKDGFTQKQMRFNNGLDENHYFENVYLDEKCTTEASEVVNQSYEENGNKNYFVYVKANSKWNTDATGTSAGAEKSTDYEGVHHNTTICLDFPRAIVATTQSGENFFSYIITDLWGKRLTNYSERTTSGTQKTPFENVEDKTGPVLISVKTGQENHTEYDGTKGAESQPSYDSHNFIEFVYSEFVNFGSKNSNGADEVFLEANDEEIEKAKNIQVTQKFGALQNEDITQSGELKFAGLAKIQNGKIYTGSQNNQGNADKYVNALYRFDKYSLRYSIAGYTHPTEFVQDDQGNNHKKWIGYIEEAELPTGTVSMICDGKNDLVFDMAGNSQTLVKNNLTVDSSKSGVYGNWDISKPIFAPFRLNEKLPWQESECIEAIGNNYGFGVTLDRVEFHLLDNTPSFDNSDEAVWITERGWCKNDSSQTLILEDSYCADIFGGSRAFETNKENRSSGGIRFSSLENGVKAFLYTTDTESSPSEKFDISKNVIVGTNARLFTGNATTFRDSKQIDGLYFSLPLVDDNLELKTTFKLSYDDKIGYITDLAGNRLKSKTSLSVDRVPPSIETILSPIDNKTFYIIFTKKINQAEISLLDNDNNKIEISESFLELLPQCFELITINDDGTFAASDIQIDSKIAAEPVFVLDNGNYTAFKMAFTRDVSLEDVKNVYLRVVNPKKYDYKMCDPITNIKDSYVTLIQDDLGNYIDMFQTHAISEVAINGINPLYGYNSSIQEDKKPITSTTQDEVSFVVRDWNENQQNYGTFYHDKDITIVCDVDNASKSENNFVENVNLYFNNDTENKMTSEQFNKKIGGNLRIWFPNIMENHFDFFTYNKNASYGTICSERVDEDDISAGLKFEFPKSVVENWKSENQISYLFSYLNEDNSQVNIYPAPKYNLLTGLYELNNSMKFPLFAIRMKDVNDITSLDLWSFKVKSVTNQRGGVTILNNVINATYGEKAIVKINLPQDGNLDVMVMTLDGNIVTYLNHGATTSGEHYFTWNGTNNAGSKVARGLYFVRVISSTIDETRKIMVVKD